MCDDWECADCLGSYAECQCWRITGSEIESAKHELNWYYDYCFGNTEIPPNMREWDKLQALIKEATGKYWNPCTAKETDELKQDPWNLSMEEWYTHWPESVANQQYKVDADIENGPDLHCWEGPPPKDWPPIEWFK